MTRLAQLVAALVATTVVAGCAVQRPPRYTGALDEGDRARIAGRSVEAAHAYERAADATRRPMDHDEAVYRAAQAYRRAGDVDTALARFDWLAAHGADLARAPRAALEAVMLRLDRGEVDRAEHDAVALMRRDPTSGPALRALERVLIERDARDPTGALALAWLDDVVSGTATPELAATVGFERARRLERLGRVPDALRAYATTMAIPFPANARWDDGGIAYAELLLAQGRPRDALEVADRVLGAREGVVMVPGSYDRPQFPPLAMLRGRILRDGLHDPRAAADAFHAVYATFPTSLLRDDALEAEALARELAGDHGPACAVWAQLGREFACTHRGREGAARAAACGSPVPADAARACRPARRPG